LNIISIVFTLLSIKTRIETAFPHLPTTSYTCVFTLLSIKTRIETCSIDEIKIIADKFLLYYPLKQGLKLSFAISSNFVSNVFTLLSIKTRIETI